MEVELHQDFTDRIDLLSKAIDKVVAHGETRMYDAIYQVCEEKMVNTQGRRNANLNQVSPNKLKWVHADAFAYARQMQKNGEQFDATSVKYSIERLFDPELK